MALPFFDTTMIHLTPNAASNVVSLSPFQARKYLATFTHYLIVLTNEATEATHAAVLNTSVDNERETKFDLPTDAMRPVRFLSPSPASTLTPCTAKTAQTTPTQRTRRWLAFAKREPPA